LAQTCPVLYSVNHSLPSNSPKQSDRWVGITKTEGVALPYLILTDDTQKVITRCAVHFILDPASANLRAHPSPSSGSGESPSTLILLVSASDLSGLDIESPDLELLHFSPDKLLVLTFICDMDEGSKYQATVERS
jgi:hypothetical protein